MVNVTASRMTGVKSYTRNQNARKKWMITQSMRNAIIRQLLYMAGVEKSIDSPQDLTNHGITRDNSDLKKIMQGIHSTLNS